MTANPYQIRGRSIPPMLGRSALFTRLCEHLEKPTPDHVTVAGPKSYGKSVMLSHLAKTYRDEKPGHFSATAFIDLTQRPPPLG